VKAKFGVMNYFILSKKKYIYIFVVIIVQVIIVIL